MAAYPKAVQLRKDYGLARDPARLLPWLGVAPFASLERAVWYTTRGRCMFPRCPVSGRDGCPLELHHVLPRSQSRGRRDDPGNLLALCGDATPYNHHDGLHGEATPGRAHWAAIGVAPGGAVGAARG